LATRGNKTGYTGVTQFSAHYVGFQEIQTIKRFGAKTEWRKLKDKAHKKK